MGITNIEWCDWTWNPVWGCDSKCPYCYARKIAKRFGWRFATKEIEKEFCGSIESNYDLQLQSNLLAKQICNFIPTWIQTNFEKKFPKKPSRIFVNSMSDISSWRPEWIERVLEKIDSYPQHKFLFLTKIPNAYLIFAGSYPKNIMLGTTVESNYELTNRYKYHYNKYRKLHFLSIEPMQYEITDLYLFKNYGWVIIGSETGNRKGKVVPKKEWIDNIVNYCKKNDIPVFMKNSLKNIYPELIQEFPE